MFWFELIPCGLFLTLLFFVSKSPKWYSIKEKEEEGFTILEKTHSPEEAEREIKAIKDSLKTDNKDIKVNYFTKAILAIIMTGTKLSVLQYLKDINKVLYYWLWLI